MKSRPTWSQGALARVREAGDKAFVAFLDEVSASGTKPLISHLPPVKGFRKGTPAGLLHQKRALAGKFTAVSGVPVADKTRAEAALYAFWRTWGKEHLGDPAMLGAFLADIEEAFDKTTDDQDSSPLAAQADALFVALKDSSMENRCSREQIERFFYFSPFDTTPVIEGALAGAKSAKDVERDAELHGLPDRLEQDEQYLRSLEERLVSLAELVDIATTDIHELRNKINDLDGRDEPVEVVAHQLDVMAVEATQVGKDLASLKTALAQQEAKQSRGSATLSNRLDDVAKALGDFNADKEVGLQAQASRIEELESLLLELQQEFSDYKATSSRSPIEVLNQTSSLVDGAPPNAAPVLLLEPLQAPADPHCVTLGTWGEAYDILSDNLATLGLKRSACETLSREICAAVTTRCLIQFRGSFATPVARIAALSLFGDTSHRLAMPLGSVNARELDAALKGAQEVPGSRAVCVVLEGLNNVPVEFIAEILRDYLAGEVRPRTAFFASLNSGLSTIPLSSQNLELGPVVDLDMLDWRLSAPNGGTAKVGQLTPSLSQAEFRENPGNRDELLELLRSASRRNPLMESLSTGFHSNLHGHCEDPVASLQGVAFGWLWPLWSMSGVGFETIDTTTEGGRFGASLPDPRFSALLAELKTGRGTMR